jgi:hypothetical protein
LRRFVPAMPVSSAGSYSGPFADACTSVVVVVG